jgi:TetR/AcrR family transcriptional regulator, cholesterol catabolism regulator
MNELISKISNLFNKYGIKSITMDDIARELGISKKTLYQHFENKNDIINKVAQYEIKSEHDELAKLCTLHSNAIDQLLMISKHIISKLYNLNPSLTYSMNKYYPLIWENFLKQRKEYILTLLKQNFQTGMEQGIYLEDINIDIITVFRFFLLDIKGFEIYKEGLNGDYDKMFNALFMFHIRGIANNKGIKYLEDLFNKNNKTGGDL